MKLANASRHFNNDFVYDGYTNSFLFQAHTSAHDDHTSSGATARRRTMRTVPGTTPPARRVVKLGLDYWLVGNSNDDTFNSQTIRRSYGLKKSTGLMSALSPAAACLGNTGTPFHAQIEYYRDLSNPLTESELDTMFNIYCPFQEPITKGTFLRQNNLLYRVRNIYDTVDEYQIAETDGLDADALQTAHFTSNGEVSLVDDLRPMVSITTGVIQTDDLKFYRFRDAAEADRKPGDLAVFVPASALAVQVGAEFDMLGQTWQVRSVQPELDAWALHVRLI